MIARYLEHFLHQASEHAFGQEAVEHAVYSGSFPLTYHLPTDLATLFGPATVPTPVDCDLLAPPETRYDQCIQAYQSAVREREPQQPWLLAA